MEINREQIEKSKDYVEDVLKNWALWQTHHSKLTQSMRDMLVLIEVYEQEIKELTEENERLKGRNEHLAECLDIEDKYKDRLQGILLQFTDIVHKWGNKNGYDTSEISLVPVIYEANTIKSQIVADTVRKMQERLKEFFANDDNLKYNEVDAEYINECIYQIAKEMLEGNNER